VLHQGLGVWERNVHLCEYLATEVLGTVHRFLLTLNPSPKDNIGSGFLLATYFGLSLPMATVKLNQCE
jgi:hypothetical protein